MKQSPTTVMDHASARRLKRQLTAILTASADDVDAAISVSPDQASALADAFEAVSDSEVGRREWLGQGMVALPPENWVQHGDVFAVTPTPSASLRYLTQANMEQPDIDRQTALESRAALIRELRTMLPDAPNHFAPMFAVMQGPENYPLLEDVALTNCIQAVEEGFYDFFNLAEQGLRETLGLSAAICVPTPPELIPGIADDAMAMTAQRLRDIADGPDAVVNADHLVARVLCNVAANRVLLEQARIGACARQASDVSRRIIAALNSVGTTEAPQIEGDAQIAKALNILFCRGGPLKDFEGMSRPMTSDHIEATIRAAHAVQAQYVGTRAFRFRDRLVNGDLTPNDTFLFALALAGLYQAKTYVPNEFPNGDKYASFPGRGTLAEKTGNLKPHALELAKCIYGQIAFSNAGWELRGERISEYVHAIDYKRSCLQMLVFSVFKRWPAGKIARLHQALCLPPLRQREALAHLVRVSR